jgi:predicted nucleic acid-binding protein
LNYLLDTNIISEIRKGRDCDPHVAMWYDSIDEESIYVSVLVLGEIRKGIERARSTNPGQARALEKWLSTLSQSFANRILTVDLAVAD